MKKREKQFTGILSDININNSIRYLECNGWKETEIGNPSIRIFEKLFENNKIEYAMPANDKLMEKDVFIEEFLNSISDIEDISKLELIGEITGVHFDVLFPKLTSKNVTYNSIPYPKAQRIVNTLYDLLAHTATAEKTKLPYFRRNSDVGIEYAENCRFGHTFKGSFGFTIESPLNISQIELDEDYISSPFERKVFERIIRGLYLAENEEFDYMVENYHIGLNSNMCFDLINLVEINGNIEFNVDWSKKYKVSKDLCISRPPIINQKDQYKLEDIGNHLRNIETPSQETVVGKVTRLHKKVKGQRRIENTITIKGKTSIGKNVTVKMTLPQEIYKIACDAHRDSQSIKVSGRIIRQNRGWIMEDPNDFSANTSLLD